MSGSEPPPVYAGWLAVGTRAGTGVSQTYGIAGSCRSRFLACRQEVNMLELTEDLPDPEWSTPTVLVGDRRPRVPDLWEAVRTGLDRGIGIFPRLRETDA
jgi:hypothetical protein